MEGGMFPTFNSSIEGVPTLIDHTPDNPVVILMES